MKAGLSDAERKTIHNVLDAFPEVHRCMLFGSRAMGTNKEGSDVDLVLFGNIDMPVISRVHSALEDTSLPYFFDVLGYNFIESEAVRKHIDDVGLVIYERE